MKISGRDVHQDIKKDKSMKTVTNLTQVGLIKECLCRKVSLMTTVKRVEVKTFIERLYCGCGDEIVPTGIVHFTSPRRYPHSCRECGYKETFTDKKYPRQLDVEQKGGRYYDE